MAHRLATGPDQANPASRDRRAGVHARRPARAHGRTVSLASLRGRIVVFESMDSECTLERPIASQEFVEAAHDLGKRSGEVVFVGVNVNQ